jgi:predicted alpha/beta hydrolase family esterase
MQVNVAVSANRPVFNQVVSKKIGNSWDMQFLNVGDRGHASAEMTNISGMLKRERRV